MPNLSGVLPNPKVTILAILPLNSIVKGLCLSNWQQELYWGGIMWSGHLAEVKNNRRFQMISPKYSRSYERWLLHKALTIVIWWDWKRSHLSCYGSWTLMRGGQTPCCLYLPFRYVSAAYQASLILLWVFWFECVSPKCYPWQDQTDRSNILLKCTKKHMTGYLFTITKISVAWYLWKSGSRQGFWLANRKSGNGNQDNHY